MMRRAGQLSSRHGDGMIVEARIEVGEVEVRGAVGKIGGEMRAAVEQDTQMRTPAHMRLTAVGGSERRAVDVRAKAKAVVGEDPEATVDGAHDRFLPQPPEAADARPAAVPAEQRSEELRVGNECVSTCQSWWYPYH